MIVTSAVVLDVRYMASKPESLISPEIRKEMRKEAIGKRLALLREALELRPGEISDILDIERTYWSRFEGGKRKLSDDVAVLLVSKFGVTLDFLMLGRWEGLPLGLAEKMRAAARADAPK